ncbi:MAG: cell division protein FtsZ [Candidatus Zambryskibacteria bacterium RIFCSPLOWO2_01_FULL_39_39]|uniref:Cell division protein FtsZ n=1 Tax=Candidatus Zambryskibacteria bacterium RIFCSPLOWO2_01_FULL_39_39 TaxID=1802758 RepID=A0A1G2TZI1_9BACT|nr:MAG: Cell division protein ftsZ [Parcubacteria group bacterium GW2011_GWA1_38_7]OHA87173.1 MAG: cell division protein FtsZ [Candidatus Zambryskibacteria bacterium RIFCSPHIGHO2_01_FULL_39_63]OHA94811.1 MAG: cell division protein FtsZ [Candidatus Zambryskibacteria bacterium RIFCSPHIGHO2_02_FULL_39_19]OHA98301.1 MAG: cell division protein FtsZ [Candidatus Zambryskibacteria bacterium RIFCSPHIGHO2_12_FULL_39_21]OHB02687.1 MAG: cell division protein FtsZ [Candidatus Zambryskibacteria bacterium RIF
MPQIKSEVEIFARIKVIGVGGSGKNAINHMINSKVKGVEFISVNTDAQDLHHSEAKKKIHIGKNLTRGLGTGMNPELGKRAVEETKEEIQEAIKGADMVFIAYGSGGGTGTGAGPVVARTARELGALTVGVVTKPFSFEGQQKMRLAEAGLEELHQSVDALIVIPNDRLLATIDKETSAKSAFAMCDDILKQAVEGISDLITMPGIINIDFADVRAIMESAGGALMGIGRASGEKRAEEAAKMAINSPLLEVSINGAKGVLFSIAGGDDLTMFEIHDAAKFITESVDPNAKIIFGTVRDEKLKKGEVKITVIASGFPENYMKKNTFEDKGVGEEASKGRIFNSVFRSEKAEKKDTSEIKVVAEESEEKKQNIIDDDDEWGAVPAFLRRSKLK